MALGAGSQPAAHSGSQPAAHHALPPCLRTCRRATQAQPGRTRQHVVGTETSNSHFDESQVDLRMERVAASHGQVASAGRCCSRPVADAARSGAASVCPHTKCPAAVFPPDAEQACRSVPLPRAVPLSIADTHRVGAVGVTLPWDEAPHQLRRPALAEGQRVPWVRGHRGHALQAVGRQGAAKLAAVW